MGKGDNPTEVQEKTTQQEEHTKQPGTGAFSKLSRELSDTDLKNPAVGRMLLDKIDTLLSEKVELESFREKFYETDKKSAILEQKASGENKFQVLYSFCLAVGGVVFGIAFATQNEVRITLIIAGATLFLIGTVLSFFLNKK